MPLSRALSLLLFQICCSRLCPGERNLVKVKITHFELNKETKYSPGAGKDLTGEVVVSGDFEGDIKVFINRRNI